MKTRMIKRKGTLLSSVAVLSTAMLLTACGGDGGDSPVDDFGSNPGEGDNQALLYAYPDNGQGEISTAAPVVLRFSSAVNLGEAGNAITLYEGDPQDNEMVGYTPQPVEKEPNNVMLEPDEDLKPNQKYTVVIDDLRLRKGVAKDQTLTFTTRPLNEGPKDLVVKKDTFEVSRHMPDGSEMEPVMDFSSFRFQFTQPIDRATATYGDSVTLTSSGGDIVDATLLIDGAYMTVDPDAEYLNAGETYTLDITADLASTYGQTFGADSYTFTPKDSSPGRDPAILVQKLTQGNTSRLTGKPINQVPVNGTLLGEDDNITQASAEVVRAELADVTTYTDVTPIRLPKGTVLNGAEINPILIGGEVPAGFGSGDVTMTVLSDASGYLVPNPYAENNPDALRIVHLMMDVGIATSEARANGAFTQDLLHIELVGLAEVDPEAGVLNLDAVSMVEPNILGQEYGYGMLSFQLQSYKDQSNPPEGIADTEPPTLQSWSLDPMSNLVGDKATVFRSGESIVLNFDDVLDPDLSDASVVFYRNGVEQADVSMYVDGSALVVTPQNDITYNYQNQQNAYRLQVNGISDLAGNEWNGSIDNAFALPNYIQNATQTYDEDGPTQIETAAIRHSPILLSAYPGFPCALNESEADLVAGIQGRCEGGFPGQMEGGTDDIIPRDDLLPVQALSSNKPIIVQFSKLINPASVRLNSTFSVNKVDVNGSSIEAVPGQLSVKGKTITFVPDFPWEEGAYYRYTVSSNGDSNSSAAICDGTGSVCGLVDGLPIQTAVFADLDIKPYETPKNPDKEFFFDADPKPYDGGGPDFRQYFKGGSKTNSVVQVLKAAPASDVNANFRHDRNPEVTPDQISDNLSYNPAYKIYRYDGGFQEPGAENQPSDPYVQEGLDPNGVQPPPNSAKTLSREGPNSVAPQTINGASFGCGYSDAIPQGPLAMITGSLECPRQKFTYLNSALVAEVTEEFDTENGIKVLIWPAQIMSSSVPVFTQFGLFSQVVEAASGAQILRMRYEKDENGNRNQPITGWITQDNGNLVLTADVDLYMDGVDLATYFPINEPSHNLFSKPIAMQLSGNVNFLSDGRMVIEQYNINNVDVDIKLYSGASGGGGLAGDIQLRIPAYGSRLQYISESIK